ncbi:MAG TPA: MAPEG family protein [Arenimonas sp.]|nr:MAPEG family protein [Arenimonas sp.]
MINTAFFLPAFALVLLTFCVMIRMLTGRIAEMKANKIHPQSIATSAALIAKMPDTRASDNFRNLFETPVLFYAAMLFAQATSQAGQVLLALAWLYVVLRVVHSIIQCSYNKVMHRFYVFFTSVWVLLGIWVTLAVGYIR